MGRFFRGRFLIISVLFHVLLIGAATYLVVQTFSPRKKTFQAPPAAPQNQAVEHQVQMAKKQKSMSAPAPAKRITTTGLAKVVLPEMPDMPTTDQTKVAAITTPGLGLGAGVGGTGSGKPGGGMPFFGVQNAKGLTGTFYDLKQGPDGKPNDMASKPDEKEGWGGRDEPTNKLYDAVLERLVRNGMAVGSLSRFFRAPQALTISQIYIPAIPAADGPKAFNISDKVLPKRWIVLYKGTVITPEDGNFRFVGYGDDILVVRLNGRIVLDGSLFPTTKLRQEVAPGRKTIGLSFETRKGAAYKMEILMGERPGGSFLAFLLLMQNSTKYDGSSPLPLFKLAPSPMPQGSEHLPPLAPDTSWSVWKVKSGE